MFHNFYFFARKASLDREGFHRHYLEKHPVAGGKGISYIKRYIQNHRIPELGGDSVYDAVSEFWSDILVSMKMANQEAGTADRLIDENNFMDPGLKERFLANDDVIVAGTQCSGMVQGIFQLKRKSGMMLEDFRRYWRHTHAPIVSALPGLRFYQQCLCVDDAYEYTEPRLDGVEEIWFDDVASARKALNSVEFVRRLRPDLENFTSLSSCFFAEARLLMWPGKSKRQVFEEIAARVADGWIRPEA
ncbi:MAG TPA: EthD family reductase [Candidatus Binataceae bacterium]|nr:EthD family reductase [Candidatus Binataceae bacterium]